MTTIIIISVIAILGIAYAVYRKYFYKLPITYKSVELPEKSKDARMLVIGQSNAANSGLGDYTPILKVLRVDNSYNLVPASNPIGGTGLAGSGSSFMPILGDLLLSENKYETIEYANVAVAGSRITSWSPGEINFARIEALVNSGVIPEFTHIIFHQGESDTKVSTHNYKAMFLTMLQGIRDLGINAPIYVARTSWLNGKTDSDIIAAHTQLSEEYSDIFPGPYTDLMGSTYRYDNSHFNEKGIISHAKMWNHLID